MIFQLLIEKWPLMTSKWPQRPICGLKRVFEVYSDLLSDLSEKVIIFGPFSCFGLKTASNDLGGQIWPHPVPIIWGQGTFFVKWHTPKICFLLWLFEDSNKKWPLMASKWPQRPTWICLCYNLCNLRGSLFLDFFDKVSRFCVIAARTYRQTTFSFIYRVAQKEWDT